MSLDLTDDAPTLDGRKPIRGPVGAALVIGLLAAACLATLVLTTDPSPENEQRFVGLVLMLGACLGSAFALTFGRRTDHSLADTFRALRRGALLGLACAGAAVLQLNAAFTPPNLAFLLLVLLIVEMIFLARRQHPI